MGNLRTISYGILTYVIIAGNENVEYNEGIQITKCSKQSKVNPAVTIIGKMNHTLEALKNKILVKWALINSTSLLNTHSVPCTVLGTKHKDTGDTKHSTPRKLTSHWGTGGEKTQELREY